MEPQKIVEEDCVSVMGNLGGASHKVNASPREGSSPRIPSRRQTIELTDSQGEDAFMVSDKSKSIEKDADSEKSNIFPEKTSNNFSIINSTPKKAFTGENNPPIDTVDDETDSPTKFMRRLNQSFNQSFEGFESQDIYVATKNIEAYKEGISKDTTNRLDVAIHADVAGTVIFN